tara:strand:+ start:5962 stop:7254 length:1293 start_codon:yes stop_codon:yes gene_type:complete
MSTITRRSFMAGAVTLASVSIAVPGLAATPGASTIRIGTVFPARTGNAFILASINDFIGTAGRIGALLAETRLSDSVEAEGGSLDLLLATSPTVEAAIRAGERLVEQQDICALIGGVGEGQAEVLAEIAAAAKIPFFNIGETADAFRSQPANPYVFHVEASDAMYLDAMGQLAARNGQTRWAVVSDTSARGVAMAERVAQSAEKAGCTIEGIVSIVPALPVYADAIEELSAIEVDVIFILVAYQDQFPLLVQMEEIGMTMPVLTFPHTITQTRDFMAASRSRLPVLNPQYRVGLWDPTDDTAEAEDFNLQIRARYAEPADPTAWAAYHAVKIVVDTVLAVGSTDAQAMIAHLEAPDTVFEVAKGPGISFRPWDHQLRQPLVVSEVDNDVVWRQLQLTSRINVAHYAGKVPEDVSEDDAKDRLDLLGDGPR